MMTQSVMTQTANLFANSAGSVTVKGKQPAGKGFDVSFSKSLNRAQSTPDSQTTASADKTAERSNSATGNGNSDVAESSINQTDQNTQGISQATQDTKTVEQKESTGQTDDKITDGKATITKAVMDNEVVLDDQLLTQIAGMLQNIQKAVMETLNISSEEFNQLLTDQGMNITDLLMPENLQQLVLADSGKTDMLAVLTDENLEASMKDLLQKLEDIKNQSGLGITLEKLKEILAKADNQSPAQTQQTAIRSDITSMEKPEEVNKPAEQSQKADTAAKINTGKDSMSVNDDSGKNDSMQAVKADDSKQSSFETKSDTGRHEHQELKSDDQFQTIINHLVKASGEKQVDFTGKMVQVTDIREIANQIIEHIKVTVTADQSSMELQLNPENLGKVNLNVQSKNGIMTAQFVVQNEVSKEAIESQLSSLKETLNQQGIKVEAIEVTVSSYTFDDNSKGASQNQEETNQKNLGRQITLEEAGNMTETPDKESISGDITGVKGSQIDYTA